MHMNTGENKKYMSKRFWIRCICMVLVFISGIVFSFVLLKPFWLNIIQDKIIFTTNQLSNDEINFLHGLISSNKIHTADFVFERLIHFYENLITIIVSISAFLGIIGYLYIKNSHQRDIYDGIYSLFNSDMGLNLLKDIINKDAKKYFEAEFNKSLNYGDLKDLQIATQNNSEENEEILKRLNIIETQIEKLSDNKAIDTEKIEEPQINQSESIAKGHNSDVAVEIDTENTTLDIKEQETNNAEQETKRHKKVTIKGKK